MYRSRRSRGGSRILFYLLLLVALGAAALAFFQSRGQFSSRSPGTDDPSAGSSVPDGSGDNAPDNSGDVTNSESGRGNVSFGTSGIPCTLHDLGADAIHRGQLILVNKDIHYVFPEEQELVCVLDVKSSTYYVRDRTVYLDPEAMTALDNMMNAFAAQGGSKTVNVVAGYRTMDDQEHLYTQSLEKDGQEYTDHYVAQPGESEHHTGYVIDFSLFYAKNGTSGSYDGTGEYAWINSHCQEYGYVVRYDQAKAEITKVYDEPWHFRYVGIPHATKMTELGYCLEEYTDYLKGFPYEGQHLTISCAEGDYEVWYCEGSQAYLPDKAEYTVSGNNVDGLIVTCKITP